MLAGLTAAILAACAGTGRPSAPAGAPVPAAVLAPPAAMEVEPVSTLNLAALTDGAAVELVSEPFPPIAWDAAPPCQNHPLDTAGWQALLAEHPEAAPPALRLAVEPAQALAAPDPAQAERATLRMNVASGRLNRATQIQAAGLPGAVTVGELIDRLDSTQPGDPDYAALIQAARQAQTGQGILQPVCAQILFTQYSRAPGGAAWGRQGIRAAEPPTAAEETGAQPDADTLAQPRFEMDTGVVSPDGRLAAFTSLAGESGGPIFLLDLRSGAWTNLIAAVNQRLPDGQPPLQEDRWWEIAGWFPDSRRILLSPADLSAAFLVDLRDFTSQAYGFPSGGLGGARLVQLAPDGQRFVFFGFDPAGGQSLNAYDLFSGAISTLAALPPEAGLPQYPRFSPDGSQLAYLAQSGHPLSGLSYSLNVFTFSGAGERVLTQGNLGQTVPVWSPDGQWIAFSRLDPGEPDRVVSGQPPAPQRGNVWVVPAAGGAARQVTFLDGWARSPAWNRDSRTLAFVTHDGQIGMVSLDQPGRIWRAAETSSQYPLLTSVFFIP